MTDLKVWVDGKERVIRGVSQGTTCESVVLVLAKAAGKSGKFALVEKWRDFERILPRNENPLKCLRAWGSHEKDVRLVLQDDNSQEETKELPKSSIKLTVDKKHDLINKSVDCRSLENFTAVQERKLKSLSRASEILDFQLSCWDDNDEKFLYLTEDEIIEDFSLKLSQTVKLQAKELDELPSLQTELNELQQSHEESTSKFELYSQNFSQFESEIEDTYDVIEKLLIQINNYDRPGQENVADVSSDVQNEIRVLQLELEEQNRLSTKQDKELETIHSSVSELTKAFNLKTKEILRLSNELTTEEVFYDLDEHFRPLSPEEEPYLYRQSLSSDIVDNDLSSVVYTENIAKELPDVKTLGSNTNHTNRDLPSRSSSRSPEEFFRNWSSSSRLANPPLNYFPLVNGVKTSQSDPARLSIKSKIDSESSERNWENGENETTNVNGSMELFDGGRKALFDNSFNKTKSTAFSETRKTFHTSSSTGKDKFPLSRMQNKKFSQETTAATSRITQPSTSSSHRTMKNANIESESHFQRENSTGETMVKGMRKDSKDNLLFVGNDEKEDVLASSSKTQTMPKPVENITSVLGYQNAANSSNHEEANSRLKSGSEIQTKTKKLPPATFPKPWRKTSSGSLGTTRAGTTALVSKSILDQTYLSPPAMQHKRTHHRKDKPLSQGDLCEEGVFV